MVEKYLIITLFVSILITESIGQTKPIGEVFNHPIVLSNHSIISEPKNFHLNTTSVAVNSSDEKSGKKLVDTDDWEPLECTQCLSDRYLLHYEERGCKPIEVHYHCRKPCPKYFQCPAVEVNSTELNGCAYYGKVYQFSEEVPVKNPCRRGCFCDQNLNDKNMSEPRITCASVDCPINFRTPDPNCFLVYDEDKCCGTEKCLTPEEIAAHTECLYDGYQYKMGQKIFPIEDPCIECVCDTNWNQTKGLLNKSCKKTNCDLQLNANFRAGCLPIYHEQECCPHEYFCLPPEEQQCKFNGKNYLIGEKIDIGLERTECKCIIPPDFTCIKKIANVTQSNNEEVQIPIQIDITNNSTNPI